MHTKGGYSNLALPKSRQCRFCLHRGPEAQHQGQQGAGLRWGLGHLGACQRPASANAPWTKSLSQASKSELNEAGLQLSGLVQRQCLASWRSEVTALLVCLVGNRGTSLWHVALTTSQDFAQGDHSLSPALSAGRDGQWLPSGSSCFDTAVL